MKNESNISTDPNKRKVPMTAVIIGVVAIIVLLIIFNPFGSKNNKETVEYSRNEIAKVREDNITIKINSVDEMYKEGIYFGGNYLKVNVTLTNESSETVTVPTMFFDLITENGETIYSNSFAGAEDGALEN